MLHGAPNSILPNPARGAELDPYERTTFCVNIWVGHRPRGCERFQQTHLASPMQRAAGFRFRQPNARVTRDALRPRETTVNVRACTSHQQSRGAKRDLVREEQGLPRQCLFEIEQTNEPHTLTLMLPDERVLRRAIEARAVLRIVSGDTRLHPSSKPIVSKPLRDVAGKGAATRGEGVKKARHS